MRAALLALGCALAVPAAQAQWVQVSGLAIEIEIPVLGTGYGTGIDTSARLTWQGAQGSRHKISVQSLVLNPTYSLSVTALAAQGGRSAGTVVLASGMLPQDLVTDLSPGRWHANKVGEATLRYEASVPSGTIAGGEDIHRVIYTITAQ